MNKEEENRRVRYLQKMVDLSLYLILTEPTMTWEMAHRMLQSAKGVALKLFPDKEETFELIYTPRFLRAIQERFS